MALTRERRRQIGKLAVAVRGYLGLDEGLLFDVDRAVVALNGKLTDVSSWEDVLDVHDANVKKIGDDSFEIRVAPMSGTRRRFSIAHELGHLFLHMGFLVDEDRWGSCTDYDVYNRSGISTEEEHEANEFAGALLMPEEEFRRVAENHRDGSTYDTGGIAEAFGVSLDAARTRGRWLGLFSWT